MDEERQEIAEENEKMSWEITEQHNGWEVCKCPKCGNTLRTRKPPLMCPFCKAEFEEISEVEE